MSLSLRRMVDPQREPVSLAAMKAHLALDTDFTTDDALIGSMLAAARQEAEDFLGQALMPQQWLKALDAFPQQRFWDGAPARPSDYYGNADLPATIAGSGQAIALPRPPLISVDSIRYVDPSSSLVTLAPEKYQVDSVSEPGRVAPAPGEMWPATGDALNAVRILFTCGRVTSASLEPIQVPAAAPYRVELERSDDYYRLVQILEQDGSPVAPGKYMPQGNGVVLFGASLAGARSWRTTW